MKNKMRFWGGLFKSSNIRGSVSKVDYFEKLLTTSRLRAG